MNSITTKAFAKVAAVATGLAMATSMLSLAPLAHAASACAFTVDLKVGSTGTQVTCLQTELIAAGYSIPAGATGYFGSQTKAAVSAWQAANNVTPAVGYFGPISRGVWVTTMGAGGMVSTVPGCTSGALFSSTTGAACTTTTTSTVPGCTTGALFSSTTGAACTTTTTTTTTGGALTGTGRLTNESSLGDVTATLYVGSAATSVVGDSFTATGGDVQLQRGDATFDLSGVTTGSTNFDQYASEVSLYLGDTKLASMDASAGDKLTNVWTYRFSGLSAIIRKGDTGKIYVKVTPLTSIGNNQDDAGAFAGTLNARLLANAVRAVGADGVSDTYVASNITNAITFSSAITGTLTASPASDNPLASQVMTSSSTKTGIKILSFNLKAKNSSAKITNLRISLNTSDNNLSDVVNTVYLMKGSTVLKSATLSTGTDGVVTFSSISGETVAKDATVNYTIVVDLKAQNTSYVDGATLIASTTVAGWDVADADGNTVTPSAAVSGNTQTLTGTGIAVVLGTPTASAPQTPGYTGQLTSAQFTIPFTVTAGDTAVWISGKATATTSVAGKTAAPSVTQQGVVYATTTTSTATTTTTSIATVSATNPGTDSLDANTDTTGGFYVAANGSRTFTLNLTSTAHTNMTPGTPNGVGFQITGINYSTASTMATTYYTSNISTFKTPDSSVQKGT